MKTTKNGRKITSLLIAITLFLGFAPRVDIAWAAPVIEIATTHAELATYLNDTTVDIIEINGELQLDGAIGIAVNSPRTVTLRSGTPGVGAYIISASNPVPSAAPRHFEIGIVGSSVMNITFSDVQLKGHLDIPLCGGGIKTWVDTNITGANTIEGFANIANCAMAQGGGLNIQATASLNGNFKIADNYAIDHGGGALILGSLTMNDTAIITNNDALYSGGGLRIENAGILTMNNYSSISWNKTINTTGGTGGGVNNMGGQVKMYNNSSIIHNTAPRYGGGITNNGFIYISGTVNMYGNSSVAYNSTGGNGGGIWTDSVVKVFAHDNTINFEGNTAGSPFFLNDQAGIDLHEQNIKTDAVSYYPTPFTFSYNNYDINYLEGNPPTPYPTQIPTSEPTAPATAMPTSVPTNQPTIPPTAPATALPTAVPTAEPTARPSGMPTLDPTVIPTIVPTSMPTNVPTSVPTERPTDRPTGLPTLNPTSLPTAEPTSEPTEEPTAEPTMIPTLLPTAVPTPINWGDTTTNGGDATDGDGNGQGRIIVDGVGFIDVSGLPDRYYDGTAHTPKPHIEMDDGYVLVEDVDYELRYEDNIEVGQAKCFVTFIGNHMGTCLITFNILPVLNKDDHFAYIKGYEDGGFRSLNDMTRAEAAIMFARLMKNKMDVDFEAKGVFSDVKPSDWFAKEIEYLASINILKGYDEIGGGRYFSPHGAITRAEFAAIASRFDNLEETDEISFHDVSKSFWAHDAINSAAAKGWIKGYGTGYFYPNNNIIRAEVITLVNRMLERVFDDEFDKEGMIIPFDVQHSYWAFKDILETMNAHDFDRNDDGTETWINLK